MQQLKALQHCSTLYITAPLVDLAQITPGRLERSFFTNSGTEANETAILLAIRILDRSLEQATAVPL